MPHTIASMILALGLAVAACGSDDSGLPMVDCGGTVPTYGQVSVFATTCTNCHTSTLTGGDRNGAPATVNFDTYAGAMASADRAVVRVNAGTMPPGGGLLSSDEKHDLFVWALCGTPP